MKKYDFVFVYEVKNRELESICLLTYELRKRGYSVKLIETWDEIYHRHKAPKAEVTVGFAMYDDQVLQFIASFVDNSKKFVNLQWEQVRSDACLALDDGSLNIQGVAKNAHHISHGEKNKEWLIEHCGVSENKVHVTGNVSLDYCRTQLRAYYKPRNVIFGKYKIPLNKTVCMFISSFTAKNLPQIIADSELSKNSGWDFEKEFQNEEETQKQIIDWIGKLLDEDENIVFIYRSHPAEYCQEEVYELAEKQSRFLVIGEEPIKQWIQIVDKLFVWASTSITEIYAAGKSCGILRPVKIYEFMDYDMYSEARVATSFEEFKGEVYENYDFPLKEENLKRYIDIDREVSSFVRVCNVLESVYLSNETVDMKYKNRFYTLRLGCFLYNFVRNMKNLILSSSMCERLIKLISVHNNMLEKYKKHKENYMYSMEMLKKNRSYEKEIEEIISRIEYSIKENENR